MTNEEEMFNSHFDGYPELKQHMIDEGHGEYLRYIEDWNKNKSNIINTNKSKSCQEMGAPLAASRFTLQRDIGQQ